jgi:hypothetical protein
LDIISIFCSGKVTVDPKGYGTTGRIYTEKKE